jgi:hypothetical protein
LIRKRAVERTLAWPNRYWRLTIRDERREDIHQAFLRLAGALFCFNSLRKRLEGRSKPKYDACLDLPSCPQ